MTPAERVRACLGPVPTMAARELLPIHPDTCSLVLQYEWIKDWSQLEGLEYWDGQAGLVVSLIPPKVGPDAS